jgi:hypothetical protein
MTNKADSSQSGPYCTTSVRLTDRDSPALEPATTSVYAPLGVTEDVWAGVAVLGMVRLAEQALRASREQASASLRQRLRLQAIPRGIVIANHTSGRSQGSGGGLSSTYDRPVATVTVTLVLPPSAPLAGLTVHSECAGTPEQVSAAEPVRPAAEVSSKA